MFLPTPPHSAPASAGVDPGGRELDHERVVLVDEGRDLRVEALLVDGDVVLDVVGVVSPVEVGLVDALLVVVS